jgi:murein DD-endopeptidase MepM/ murein hydrolase activator NlpD
MPDRCYFGRVRLAKKRSGKGNSLAFFFIIFCLPWYIIPLSGEEPGRSLNFPVITRLDNRDTGFRQFISDVENNRRRLAVNRRNPQEIAEHLTIYQYTPREGEDLFSLAARSNIPYSALASLNRFSNPVSFIPGRTLLLPSCPGIYLPDNLESALEQLIGAARFAYQESVELRIQTAAGTIETFHFFPGADFTPTERAFFLNSGFRFPLENFRLTSPYGLRSNPITGNVVMHQGIDLAAPEGTEVFAVADGVVTETGYHPIYGNYIIISHSGRWTSLYGHLQKIETVLRSTVRSGTLIGRVGSTGQSTGPHLHFELRQDGRALNPEGRLRH